MKGREVLKQYRKVAKEIYYLNLRREELRGRMATVSAFNLSESQRNDDISRKIQQAKLDEYTQLGVEIDRRIVRSADIQKKILSALYKVTDPEGFAALDMVYIQGLSISLASKKLGVEERTVYRWIQRGIREFNEVYRE